MAVLAVDLQVDTGLGHIARLRSGGDRAHRRGGFKGLANAPGAALFLHVVLQVTPGHVQAHRIAVDAVHAHGHHQLNLMVQISGEGRVGHGDGLARFGWQHGVCGLHKKEGRLAASVAHLFGVFLVIAAHTVNAVDREALCGADDGYAGLGGWGEEIVHG